VPFADASLNGFHLQLFTRIPDATAQNDRKHAFDRFTGQTLVQPHRDTDSWSGAAFTEWRFDATVPEQVKLWLETKTSGRGFHSVDVSGPSR